MPCKNWGPSFVNCCGKCADEVKEEDPVLHCTIGIGDDGFDVRWTKGLEEVKNRFAVKSSKLSKLNKYINECPCGIHPSTCEYHK